MWTVDLEAGDIFGQVDDKVATTLKRLPHFLHATLRRIIGSFSRFLAYRTWAAGVLALQLVASLDYPFGGSDVTDTPAGHGIGFGHTVDDDATLLHAFKLSNALMMSGIVDMLVDFISQNIDAVVAQYHFCQFPQFFTRIDASCRIAWRAEYEQAGLGSDGLLELLGSHFEVLFKSSVHDDRFAVGHLDHLRITYPIGSRDDDLVALVDERHDCIAHALFGAV